MPMSNELKELLKKGVGIFSRVVIFRSKIPPHHTQLVYIALLMYAYSGSAMPLLSYTCLRNDSKWCLPSFVCPLASLVLLAYISACNTAYIGGHTFERKAHFATTSFKMGSGLIFERLQYILVAQVAKLYTLI